MDERQCACGHPSRRAKRRAPQDDGLFVENLNEENSHPNPGKRIIHWKVSPPEGPYHYFLGLLASWSERYSICGDAALEIDHAPTIGGSPPAPLRALAVPANRNWDSYRRAVWLHGADRSRCIRHALDSSVLKIVGWAKALLRRAHQFYRWRRGGHASLCPPYNSQFNSS
jgi:hypothetical protein